MGKRWDNKRADECIRAELKKVTEVTVFDYKKEKSLENIKINEAYRVDGVHMYVDIQNFDKMLESTETDGVMSHKRALRFLDLHYRAVTNILKDVDAIRVDFHGQRLHSLFTKPYNSDENAEKKRVQRAVATAALITDVLKETGDLENKIPNAEVRIGIDTGLSLAVNNGRHGNREPLFLGNPANYAAKLASNNTTKGIYLTNAARLVIGLDEKSEPEKSRLTLEEIKECQDAASINITAEAIIKKWKEDRDKYPLSEYSFSRQTPPLKDMPIADLSPKNSRRQEMISTYADIDGFTAYVSDNINDNAEDVVRTLHVLRAEMERVVTKDFSGRRVRFIGDCIHALSYEGTAQTIDNAESVTYATLMAGALRSSFDLSISILEESGYNTGELGLAIGFDLGPVSVSRLGLKGGRIRCAIGRQVIESEARQFKCDGTQTAIGPSAYDVATDAVKTLFGKKYIKSNLDYLEATESLSENGDKAAKSDRSAAFSSSAIASASEREIKPYALLCTTQGDSV